MLNPIDHIRERLAADGAPSSDFDLNPEVDLPADRRLRPAGVLIALHKVDGRWHVILTMRSSALKHHPGQIAFPGGKQDATDASITETALREAEEEIGLHRSKVEILGHLPTHETVTGFDVTPVVGVVTQPVQFTPEPGEVAEVFMAPLDLFVDPANFHKQSRRWRGTLRSYYTVPYGPYYIWGATARMLRAFSDVLSKI